MTTPAPTPAPTQPSEAHKLPSANATALAFSVWYATAWDRDPYTLDEEDLARMWEKFCKEWLTSLTEPHCGDCTNVPCACTRCHTEAYIRYAEAVERLTGPEAAQATEKLRAENERKNEALRWASDQAKGRLPDWFHAAIDPDAKGWLNPSDSSSLRQQLADAEAREKRLREADTRLRWLEWFIVHRRGELFSPETDSPLWQLGHSEGVCSIIDGAGNTFTEALDMAMHSEPMPAALSTTSPQPVKETT